MNTITVRVPEKEVVRLRLYLVQHYGKIYGNLHKAIGVAITEFLEKRQKGKSEGNRGSNPTQNPSNH